MDDTRAVVCPLVPGPARPGLKNLNIIKEPRLQAAVKIPELRSSLLMEQLKCQDLSVMSCSFSLSLCESSRV